MTARDRDRNSFIVLQYGIVRNTDPGYGSWMARADRLERLDARRSTLESEYREALIAALQKAAGGSWGLFDHNSDKTSRAKWKPIVTGLCDMGEEIDEMRSALGMEPFHLHEQFEASRGPVVSSAPGEPKQAQMWLDRLHAEAQ